MSNRIGSETVIKRLFVGGLVSNVTSTEVAERFSRFGKVSDLSLKVRRDDGGNPVKCFAHLSIEGDEAQIKKCFDAYQNSKWKGSVLKLQYAKESFLSRLEKERESTEISEVPKKAEAPTASKDWTAPEFEEIKGAPVPGTPVTVPGKSDWVVGKYGRILPVLKVKKSSKTVKHDPSKLCHTAKVFKEDKQPDKTRHNSLTWEMDVADTEITRKRKGQFSTSEKKKGDPHYVKKVLEVLKAQRKENGGEDLEIVRVIRQSDSCKHHGAVKKSNRFDSDVDSSSEDDSSPPPAKSKPVREAKSQTSQTPKQMFVDEDSNLTVKSQNRNQFNKVNKRNEKIPEFKGLGMLNVDNADKEGLGMLNIDIADKIQQNCEQPPRSPQDKSKSTTRNSATFVKGRLSDQGIPEFKGLGMLMDYNMEQEQPSLKPSIPSGDGDNGSNLSPAEATASPKGEKTGTLKKKEEKKKKEEE